MSEPEYIPDAGDIAWFTFDPRIGHEQSGRRPALVLSSKKMAAHGGLAVVMPITSKVKGLPYEIVLSGCETHGAVLPIHLKSIDVRVRRAAFIEKAPERVLIEARASASALLGL